MEKQDQEVEKVADSMERVIEKEVKLDFIEVEKVFLQTLDTDEKAKIAPEVFKVRGLNYPKSNEERIRLLEDLKSCHESEFGLKLASVFFGLYPYYSRDGEQKSEM